MKYSFQTPAPFKVNVVIDRALFSGKVKVYADEIGRASCRERV